MIGPSRRQLPTIHPRDPFALHRQLSTRRYWQQRLLACSLSALAFSLLAWALGLPLGYHALAIALGFALGFAWRVPEASPWALGFIEQQVGYSYRTALELPSDDPYGFAPAVKARAAANVRRLEPPAMQPWWLPALALALGLLLFPTLNLVAPTTPGTPVTTNGGSAPSQPPPTPPAAEAEPAEEPDVTPETPDATPFDTREADPREADSELGESELDSERDALQRALEQLRERPSEPERLAEGEAHDAAMGESEEAEFEGEVLERGQLADQERDHAREEEGEGEADEGDEGEGERAEGAEDGQAGDETAEGEGQGEDEGEAGEMQQAADPDASPEGDTASDAAADGTAPNDGRDEGLTEGEDEGLSAGNLPSGPLPFDEEVPPPSEGELEHLRGIIGDGPSSIGGEILLPGGAQEDGPSGPAAQAAERALEQAITEGRIPVEYQEILRNYFR